MNAKRRAHPLYLPMEQPESKVWESPFCIDGDQRGDGNEGNEPQGSQREGISHAVHRKPTRCLAKFTIDWV